MNCHRANDIPIIPMLIYKFLEVAVYFHAKGFGVKLFKARYFERRICLKSMQLKQNQTKINSSNLLKRYTYTTNSI